MKEKFYDFTVYKKRNKVRLVYLDYKMQQDKNG